MKFRQIIGMVLMFISAVVMATIMGAILSVVLNPNLDVYWGRAIIGVVLPFTGFIGGSYMAFR